MKKLASVRHEPDSGFAGFAGFADMVSMGRNIDMRE